MNEVNAVLNFDETFGPVLEIAYNFVETPTLAVRVPWFPPETMDGMLGICFFLINEIIPSFPPDPPPP